MTWRRLPVYGRARELALWLVERVPAARPDSRGAIARVCVEESKAMVAELALALTFPPDRTRHLAQATVKLARLRVLLRAAIREDLLAQEEYRHALVELDAIGRALDEWHESERVEPEPELAPAAAAP